MGSAPFSKLRTWSFNVTIDVLILILALTFVSSCSNVYQPKQPILAVTDLPTLTSVPTIIPFTSTDRPELSPEGVENKCWNKEIVDDGVGSFSGSILYNDNAQMETMALGIRSFHIRPLNRKYTEISQDHEVITTLLDTNIYFLSQSKENVYRIPPETYFNGFMGNKQVQLNVADSREHNYIKGVGTTDEFYILSFHTGDLTFQKIFLPYYLVLHDRVYSSLTKYSPDFKYVIYPADYFGKSPISILYDIKNQKIVWSGDTRLSIPVWMPNSKGVFVEIYDPAKGQDDLSIIYNAGHTERIPLDRGYYYSQLPSWSPNSRYLGFREHRKDDDYLVIYDLETNNIIDPCFSLGTLPLELIWSPDGNQISFTPASNPDERVYIFLLDLVDRMIYRIEKYPSEGPINLLGWVNWELP